MVLFTFYQDPKHWFVKFDECSGHRQSPVDLDLENIIIDRSLGALQMIDYDVAYDDVTIINDGRTSNNFLTSLWSIQKILNIMF